MMTNIGKAPRPFFWPVRVGFSDIFSGMECKREYQRKAIKYKEAKLPLFKLLFIFDLTF